MEPLVTVAVASLNHAGYLDRALASIFAQGVPVEVYVADGGSTDGSVEIIQRWSSKLMGWRSHPDRGQTAAINEGIAQGTAPFVCWVNSDDCLEPGGLNRLLLGLRGDDQAPVAYGRARHLSSSFFSRRSVWVEPFSIKRLAVRCIISQPATLIRRDCWVSVGGLDESLQMAFDYDLWWRLARRFGTFLFIDAFVAANQDHPSTKTRLNRRLHYSEAMAVVRKYNGSVPLKWFFYWPYAVVFRAAVAKLRRQPRRNAS